MAQTEQNTLTSFLTPKSILSLSSDVFKAAFERKIEQESSLAKLQDTTAAQVNNIKTRMISILESNAPLSNIKKGQASIESSLEALEQKFLDFQAQSQKENDNLRAQLQVKEARLLELTSRLASKDKKFKKSLEKELLEQKENLSPEASPLKKKKRTSIFGSFSRKSKSNSIASSSSLMSTTP